MKKLLFTTAALAILAALVWAANSIDVIGALRRLHGHH